MFKSLLIGCPVWRREWALEDWFLHADRAAVLAECTPEYVFVADEGDTSTIEVIERTADSLHRSVSISWIEETLETPAERVWNPSRYTRMVFLRNKLLTMVQEKGPELFLSLDSDIFLHENSLSSMMEGLEEFAAIGGKCYMTEGTESPSWMNFNPPNFERYDHDRGIVPVDVIMAIKLMTPAAYGVSYQPSDEGEDVGWSFACTNAGLRLGWDGRVVNKHVLEPNNLHVLDVRCGY